MSDDRPLVKTANEFQPRRVQNGVYVRESVRFLLLHLLWSLLFSLLSVKDNTDEPRTCIFSIKTGRKKISASLESLRRKVVSNPRARQVRANTFEPPRFAKINSLGVSGGADGQTDASGRPLSMNLITRLGTSSTEGAVVRILFSDT